MVSVLCSLGAILQTFKVRGRVRNDLMITIRMPESIHQVDVPIEGGSCHGRWHFSFDRYYDPEWVRFGTLRVFNDDTLTPGAVWPLHPHREIEVVTYCAAGEFRHADENGEGGVLKEGWVQHMTVGRGMWHSEINNRKDRPMRFVQMWYVPSAPGLVPSVEQKAVEKADRTNRFLPLISNDDREALTILSDARVLASFLEAGQTISHPLGEHRGAYLSVLGGGPVRIEGKTIPALGAARIEDEPAVTVRANGDAELLLADVLLV
jgi:redox-sensitive bicupin YhaK (pirin superfamily)